MRSVIRALSLLAAAGLAVASFAAVGRASPSTSRVSNPSFAGYQVTKTKGKITEAATTFVVPTITCKKTFSGVGPSVIVQTRATSKGAVTQSGAGVGVACQDRQPMYKAVLIINGDEDNDVFDVAPGDVIVATVHMSATATSADISDTTSSANKTESGTGGIGAIALIGDSGINFGTTSVGIDPFSKTAFTGAEVNAKPVGKLNPVAVQRTHGNTVQIAVSRLVKKQNFVLTFKHSR